MHPSRPDVLFMQKHWDVMRSDDAGDSWREVSGNLPTDFGFAIDVHAHEPETIYVVPIKSDSEHYPPDGKLRVYRSRTGGNEWEPLTKGLPQKDCYVNVLRDAMAVDSLDHVRRLLRHDRRPGLRVGRLAATRGRRSCATCRRSCRSRCRRCREPIDDRVVLPAHLRTLARVDGEVSVDVAGTVTQRAVLDALEAHYPMLRGTIRDHVTLKRRPFLRFFACEEDLSHESPDAPLPDAVARGAESRSSSSARSPAAETGDCHVSCTLGSAAGGGAPCSAESCLRPAVPWTAAVLLCLACPGTASAQVSTATIQGTVTDATGVLPGASVTAREIQSGFTHEAVRRRRHLHAGRAAAGTLRDHGRRLPIQA